MSYWLVKSESTCYSVDDLHRDRKTLWTGVRNYQARNYLRSMKKGEFVLYYHSVAEPLGIAGIAAVERESVPDPTQFDKKSEYYEKRATKELPVWFCPTLKFVRKFDPLLTRPELTSLKACRDMVLFQKRSRLSVQPVTAEQFKEIVHFADISER
jgi:predicted RNA-binding protein with PUA-like domain